MLPKIQQINYQEQAAALGAQLTAAIKAKNATLAVAINAQILQNFLAWQASK